MKTQKGITLIALIITIIVMLILVGVSVSVALNTGLFKTAQGVAKNTQIAAEEENLLSTGIITIRNSTTGKLEQVDINSFAGKKEEPVEELLDINDALSDEAAIGTKVNYSAGGVTDWRIYEKDEAAGTVTLLGKVNIDWTNITTEEELNTYIGSQYIDSNHADKIENVNIIKISDIIDIDSNMMNTQEPREMNTAESALTKSLAIGDGTYCDGASEYFSGRLFMPEVGNEGLWVINVLYITDAIVQYSLDCTFEDPSDIVILVRN